jgi:hypothetical protein
MALSSRRLGVQVTVWLAGLVIANVAIARLTANAIPRQMVRTIERSTSITDLFVGTSQIVAAIDPEAFERARPNTRALNAGIGATSIIEHDILMRRALSRHPARAFYGFWNTPLTDESQSGWRDLFGNRAMSYYVDRETAIGFIAPHDPLRAWTIRLTSFVPLIVERAALWGNVERLRRTFAGFGRPTQATNRFGRVEDFARLEQTDVAFRRACREPVERSSGLVAPVVDMLERGREAGASVVMVLMPMPGSYRDRFYSTSEWQRYVAYVEGEIRRHGGVYLDASDWVDDTGFFDAVHITPAAARTFSMKLAAWTVSTGL